MQWFFNAYNYFYFFFCIAKLLGSRDRHQVFEQLLTLQKEAAQTVAELSKSHKTYSDDEHVAHDARVKATEAASK